MRDVRELQQMLLNGKLYRWVVETEEAMRHRSEYDLGDAGQRRLALLCWYVERVADGETDPTLDVRRALP